MLYKPPFVLLAESTNVRVGLSSWKYWPGFEKRFYLGPSTFGGDQHRATAVGMGRGPERVSKFTREESHGLNLEACHLLSNRWTSQPRRLQRNYHRGRRNTRVIFQKPSKKSVSRGMEWSIMWTVYIKWSAQGLAHGEHQITSGCECHDDDRGDDGSDDVSVRLCFFSLLQTPFPLSPP